MIKLAKFFTHDYLILLYTTNLFLHHILVNSVFCVVVITFSRYPFSSAFTLLLRWIIIIVKIFVNIFYLKFLKPEHVSDTGVFAQNVSACRQVIVSCTCTV